MYYDENDIVQTLAEYIVKTPGDPSSNLTFPFSLICLYDDIPRSSPYCVLLYNGQLQIVIL